MRNAVTVRVPGAAVRETPVGEEPTDPLAVAAAGAAVPQATEAAGESGTGRSLYHKLGGRAVLLPVACVAALLVGFGTVTAVLRIGDRPAESDTRTPSTAAITPAPPSTSPPAVSAPGATAPSAPAVEGEPASPPPPPQPQPASRPEAASPAPATSTPPTTTAPTTTPSTTTPSPPSP